MKRREFLAKSGILAGSAILPRAFRGSPKSPLFSDQLAAVKSDSRISFETSDSPYQSVYASALDTLARNTTTVSGYSQPVLIEGSNYSGIWLECAPQEGLVYSPVRADVARNNHLAFFTLQREDGQIPC